MDHFGIIDTIWFNESKQRHFCRIRVLARLYRKNNKWYRDPGFDPRDLGSTKRVFMTDASKISDKVPGTPVWFSVEESKQNIGPDQDGYLVAWNPKENRYEIDTTIGCFLVLGAEQTDWKNEPRRIHLPNFPKMSRSTFWKRSF